MSASGHQIKSIVPREKRQKKAPIKINRNFATDTENNEKLQKLKQIAQKEKKNEDKMFFHMFLNIVGTEVDEDDNDWLIINLIVTFIIEKNELLFEIDMRTSKYWVKWRNKTIFYLRKSILKIILFVYCAFIIVKHFYYS